MSAKIKLNTFGGIAPKLAPRLLPDTAAQAAENVWLNDGDLQTINIPSIIEAITPAYVSIFLWRRNDTTAWLSALLDTDYVVGPIADDQWDRVYISNGGTLGMKLWDGGEVSVANVSKTKPNAPTLALAEYTWPNVNLWVGSTLVVYTSYEWINDHTQMKFKYLVTDLEGDANTFRIESREGSGEKVTLDPHDADHNSVKIYDTVADRTAGANFGTVTYVGQSNAIEDNDAYIYATFDLGFKRTSTAYRVYTCSQLDEYGQETPCSDPSDEIEVPPNQKVVVSGLSVPTDGKSYVYRSAQGTDAANFFFVAEITSGITYTDKFSDGELQDVMPVIENPPANISGLVSCAGGFLAGFYGKEVYFSEPYLPYSWPTKYRLTMDYDVVALGVGGNDLYVLTKGNPYYVTGSHPETLTVTKLTLNQSCISKRSVAHVGNTVCYASPDGLVGISGGSATLLSESTHNREDWQGYSPASMIGVVHDNTYFGFCTATTLIIKLASAGIQITTSTQLATGAYADLETDSLYMIQSGNITKWDGGATAMTMRWRSKEYDSMRRINWSSARIVAAAYTTPISLLLYVDNVLVQTISVTSTTSFRLPKMTPDRVWALELQSVHRINSIHIGTSMNSLR